MKPLKIGLVLFALAVSLFNSVPQALAQGGIEFQSILTNNGASDWEFFTIGSDSYLAVANNFNNSTSQIYKWDGSKFVEFQTIVTNGAAYDWEFFTIGSDSYLAVANFTSNIGSEIYQWNESDSKFVEFQSIPTSGAVDWEFFTIDSGSYLAVANNFDDTTPTRKINSQIYQWNESDSKFVGIQSILTNGAFDWEFFTIGSDSYLAVANNFDDDDRNIDSQIYQWNESDSEFVEIQRILTSGASDWEFFTIGSDSYLAVANTFNNPTFNIESEIYQWNGSKFVEFQTIVTNGAAYDWEFFTIGSDSYLAVANYRDDSTGKIDSKIYKWNGSKFVEFQSILTNGAYDWEFFTIGSDSYLAVANQSIPSTEFIASNYSKDVDITFVEHLSHAKWEILANHFNDSTRSIYSKIYLVSYPNLGITKSVNPTTASPGDTITYTLTFSNSGSYTATGVIITDSIPVSVTTSSVISSGVAITQTAPGYVWAVEDLASTEGGVITITGVLSASLAAGTFTNTATITTTSVDSDTTNNNSAIAINSSASGDIYLPIICKGCVTGADLIIVPSSLVASGNSITLQIQNIGNSASSNDFWVDVYFNPTQTPSLNKPWDTIASKGAIWGVTKSLAPGEVVTLVVGGTYYRTDKSSSTFISEAKVYGYVDSVNYATTYGAVLELDESNNLSGPVTSMAGAAVPVTVNSSPGSSGNLPQR